MAIIPSDNEVLKKDVSAAKTTSVVSSPAPSSSDNLYLDYDFSSVSNEEMEKRKSYCANDWAHELKKNGNSLFDRTILDSAGNVEEHLINNDEWRVDVADEEGNLESKKLLDTIVESYDSALDLYIESKVQDIINTYGPSCTYNLRAMFGSPDSEAIKELARLGIRADAVGDHDNWQNRTYTFSLVDMTGITDDMSDEEIFAHVYADDAKILTDEQGNKGSIIFADCLTADGTAQGAETNLSSILDQMGYECVSKADFLDNPDEYYKMLDKIEKGLDTNVFQSSDDTINDMYGETIKMYEAVCAVYTINGDAPGIWGGGRTFEQTKNCIEDMGDRLYTETGARAGEALDNGKLSAMTDLDEYDLNLNDVSGDEEAEESSEEKTEDKKKTSAQKEELTAQTLTKDIKQAQEDIKNLKEAQSEFEDRIEQMRQDNPDITEEEVAKQLAKEYGVDKDELLLSV